MATEKQEKFTKLLKSFDNAMLVTRTEDGHLRARPMALAETKNDGELWFATSLDSPKVEEIEYDSEVNVTMQGEGKYLSISGTAEFVRDKKMIKALWTPAWKIYFPEGKNDPNLVLIKINASEAEYWNRQGAERLRFLFKAAKGYLQRKRPDFDEGDAHAKFDF